MFRLPGKGKKVTLPNGQTFHAKFRRATRKDLPGNVNFPRKYKQRAAPKGKRRRQRGRGFKSFLGKAFGLAEKVVKNPIVRDLAKMGIAEAPGLVDKLLGSVKNKRLKSLLNSDIAKTGVNLATGFALDKLGN